MESEAVMAAVPSKTGGWVRFFFLSPERLDVCGKKSFNTNLRSITVRTPPCALPQAIPCISSQYHRIRNTKDQLASACGSF